ncbi:MAG TPA: Gfo/Idh/MocA family oxidoreductase [Polyangia bacterium]
MGPARDPAAGLRWGILGTASIAPAVIRAIRAAGCGTVAAVASRDLGRARAFAVAHAIPVALGDYAALLEPGVVDVVYNPLPNSLHAAWTIRALEAGRPVLCEKPFTVDAAEARAVAAVARRVGLPVAEAFMYRFHPLYDRLAAVLATGRIGPLVTLTSQFTFWLDDRAALPAVAGLGGGALLDVGCYCVDVARRLAGAEPRRVLAAAREAPGGPAGAVDDTLVGTLELAGGVLASFECGIASFERHRLELAGTRGAITVASPWFPGAERGTFVVRDAAGDEVVTTPGADGYELEVRDFARACTTGAPPRWPVADAVANMVALDALRASARTGTAVAVAAGDRV